MLGVHLSSYSRSKSRFFKIQSSTLTLKVIQGQTTSHTIINQEFVRVIVKEEPNWQGASNSNSCIFLWLTDPDEGYFQQQSSTTSPISLTGTPPSSHPGQLTCLTQCLLNAICSAVIIGNDSHCHILTSDRTALPSDVSLIRMDKTNVFYQQLKNGGHFQLITAHDPFQSLVVPEHAHILS